MALSANYFDVTLSVEERISKARIRLRRIAPFFSYIVERLRVKHDDSVGTIGVTPKGLCIYNEEFIKKLTDNQLIGVLVHEVMHCALRHFTRQMERKTLCNGLSIWNWAGDAQINQMILENNLELPADGVIPKDDKIDFGPITIENVSEKATEELYDEIIAQLRRMQQDQPSGGSGSGDGSDDKKDSGDGSSNGDYQISEKIQKNFDEHLTDSDDDGSEGNGDSEDDSSDGKSADKSDGVPTDKGKGSEESNIPDVDWSEVLSKAHAHSKLAGKEPAGFDRMFADLHKPKVCWRSILRRTVASSIPEEFTWNRPHKKYVAHDIYLPSTYGETIKVVCAIDTSGSIGQNTLTDFISEMVGISKAYHEAEFVVLSHDVDVHDEIPIRNGYQKKLAEMELHGGGGTSHIPLFEHIEKHKNKWDLEATVVICFTDGYSNFPEVRPKVDQIVFVLAGGHCPKEHIPDWADAVLSIE